MPDTDKESTKKKARKAMAVEILKKKRKKKGKEFREAWEAHVKSERSKSYKDDPEYKKMSPKDKEEFDKNDSINRPVRKPQSSGYDRALEEARSKMRKKTGAAMSKDEGKKPKSKDGMIEKALEYVKEKNKQNEEGAEKMRKMKKKGVGEGSYRIREWQGDVEKMRRKMKKKKKD